MILEKEYVFLDYEANSLKDVFEMISKYALEKQLITNSKKVVEEFEHREKTASTAFEDGFAIPHARTGEVKTASLFYVRLKKPLKLDSMDGRPTNNLILLMIPNEKGDYLNLLSKIATKLMKKDFRDGLKNAQDSVTIVKLLGDVDSEVDENENAIAMPIDKTKLTVVGISACATGVVHTYMARDALLEAGKQLHWNVYVETQGQKGQEYTLTQEQIDQADAVILAVDIAVDTDRFAGKKVYKVGTKTLIKDPETQLRYAVSKGKTLSKEAADSGIFDVKNKRAWIGHIMSGVSYMIPFIVFAGITFAICVGVGKLIWGKWMDYSGSWDFKDGGIYTQSGVVERITGGGTVSSTHIITGYGVGAMYLLNQFANIGFSVMMAVMGAYIANSIAGRSAITPAFVLTMVANAPNLWLHYSVFADPDKAGLMQGMGIFGALIFGFAVGYTVKWINTKWKINKYIKPIMPIIIIPLFVSVIFGAAWMFLIGNIFGLAIGYVYDALNSLESSGVGMALVGLVLGLIAGVDMGGPINKIASFSATALIFIDGGKSMGAAAASFAIAPLGCGLSSLIFRKRFKDDKELGINAVILGFMGISEGAIPFAVKYTWAAIVPNIIGSGIAAMFAGIFHVSGWVGAWGGPIIAIFGGVTTWDMSYLGALWYLVAIGIGVVVHVIIFRILVEIQVKGKLTKEDFKTMFGRNSKKDNAKKHLPKETLAKQA